MRIGVLASGSGTILEALLRRDNVAKAIWNQCAIQVVASHTVDFSNAVQDATKSTLDMLRANPDATAVYADQDFEFVRFAHSLHMFVAVAS